MSGELNPTNLELVNKYISEVDAKTATGYMLTIARDGESPVRSIYFYDNAIDAANGYEAYTDWGFARDFLTVNLYEPTGRVHSKILHRPRGGECVFHREQYHEATKILGAMWSKTDIDSYNELVYDFAKLFSRDNQRFQVERFLTALEYTGEITDDIRK